MNQHANLKLLHLRSVCVDPEQLAMRNQHICRGYMLSSKPQVPQILPAKLAEPLTGASSIYQALEPHATCKPAVMSTAGMVAQAD